MPTPISNSKFAKRHKVSRQAVIKAIRTGRLRESVNASGEIIDVDLADREWKANATQPANAGKPVNAGRGPQRAPKPAGDTLAEATLAVMRERQRKLELENAETEGRLIDRATVVKERFESGRLIREAILNIAARISGELAAETDAAKVYARLDAAHREALNAIADSLVANG